MLDSNLTWLKEIKTLLSVTGYFDKQVSYKNENTSEYNMNLTFPNSMLMIQFNTETGNTILINTFNETIYLPSDSYIHLNVQYTKK